MEVILSDGHGIQLTLKGMRRYLEKAKIDGFLYCWSGEENTEYTRMATVTPIVFQTGFLLSK